MKNLLTVGILFLCVTAITLPQLAQADVKKGVEAWGNGDYAAAVKEWHDPAINGDVDAQFNLGQAYMSGRGVDLNENKAEVWFGLAANQGHLQAINSYGLLLFKNGQRAEAMPYLDKSAERGEHRAQYIMGTAYFNGELVEKNYVKAYALMILAAEAGLPQASSSLKSMDEFLPEDERQKALYMSEEMKLHFRK
jgi:TPR repeat protein